MIDEAVSVLSQQVMPVLGALLSLLVVVGTFVSNLRVWLRSRKSVIDVLVTSGWEHPDDDITKLKEKEVFYLYIQNQRNRPIAGRLSVFVQVASSAKYGPKLVESVSLWAGPDKSSFAIVQANKESEDAQVNELFEVVSLQGMRPRATWSIKLTAVGRGEDDDSAGWGIGQLECVVIPSRFVEEDDATSFDNPNVLAKCRCTFGNTASSVEGARQKLWSNVALIVAGVLTSLFALIVWERLRDQALTYQPQMWLYIVVVSMTLVYSLIALLLTQSASQSIIQGYSEETVSYPPRSKGAASISTNGKPKAETVALEEEEEPEKGEGIEEEETCEDEVEDDANPVPPTGITKDGDMTVVQSGDLAESRTVQMSPRKNNGSFS